MAASMLFDRSVSIDIVPTCTFLNTFRVCALLSALSGPPGISPEHGLLPVQLQLRQVKLLRQPSRGHGKIQTEAR